MRYTWAEIVTIQNHYMLSDQEICQMFGIEIQKLKNSQQEYKDESIPIGDIHINSIIKGKMDCQKSGKKGRPHNKNNEEAFNSLPKYPVILEEYCKKFNIGKTILRQKRFDRFSWKGKVRIKKVAGMDGIVRTMVWREEK